MPEIAPGYLLAFALIALDAVTVACALSYEGGWNASKRDTAAGDSTGDDGHWIATLLITTAAIIVALVQTILIALYA